MSLPQREGAASLDISPDATPSTAGWDTNFNDPMNDLNKPVKEHTGKFPANGWTKELYDTNQTEEI